ncbi:MAG: phosphorylase family protein [Solirubrobacterales bacterium]
MSPARLRPTAPNATDAILVGDPGRALMLAQYLLQEPKMSNHARGLWGYTGETETGKPLTVQSTGMGGPSASVVLRDLAELGVRRAVRIGTCTSLGDVELGDLVIVSDAFPGPGGSFSTLRGRTEPLQPSMEPEPILTRQLLDALGNQARGVVSVSLDVLHPPEQEVHPAAEVADMQTAALFATGAEFEVAIAALLIVSQTIDGRGISDEELELVAKRGGSAAVAIL